MRRFDKIKNLKKANLLAEQRYLSSKGIIKENIDEIGLLEDKYNVDQLVAMALENLDLGQLEVISSRGANFSSRYRHLNCIEFKAELPITVNFDDGNFYTLTAKIEGWCEEDPDGPSGGTNFAIELSDTSFDSNLFGEDLYDKVSMELSKKLDELEREVGEYMYED